MTQKKTQRLYEIFAGVGFLLATISYSIGSNIVETELKTATDVLTTHSNVFDLGISLELINSIVVIAIGIFLFLCLRQSIRIISLGYLISRISEALLLGMGSLLALNGASQAIQLHNLYFNLAMIILGVYSVIFNLTLSNRSLGPKWLFILGTIGYGSLAIYSIINLLSTSQTAPMWLFAPGAVFEIVFPVWLMIKGFSIEQLPRNGH